MNKLAKNIIAAILICCAVVGSMFGLKVKVDIQEAAPVEQTTEASVEETTAPTVESVPQETETTETPEAETTAENG